MSPSLTRHNVVYQWLADTKGPGQDALRYSLGFVNSPYVPDLVFCKFVTPIFASKVLSALCNHVLHVFGIGAKPKVVRTNAPPDIALVKHPHTNRNWAEVDNPRSPGGADGFTSESGMDLAIAVMGTCRPKPTRFGLLDMSPKALWEGFGKSLRSKVIGCNLDHISSVLPLGLLALTAFSFSHFSG